MAKRAITNEGILCSVCGAIVQPETKLCYQCDSPLEGEFRAVICNACGSVAPAENQSCPFCGVEITQRPGVHVKPVPREVDSDILSAVDEMTAPKPSTEDAKSSLADRLKKINGLVLSLDNAISRKSWIELTSIKDCLGEMIEDAISILSSVDGIGSGQPANVSEEIRQKEQYLAQKMEELKREIETRERESLKLREKEKELLVKEQVMDDRSDAIAAKAEEVQKLRVSLDEKEKKIAAKESEIADMERRIEKRIISQAEGSEPRLSVPVAVGEFSVQTKALGDGIEKAKVLTNQLITYFKKRSTDDSAKIVVALEKITSQLDGLVLPTAPPQSAAPSIPTVPVPTTPKEPDERREELRLILKTLDTLLEKLPEDVVAQFANSEDFKLYEKVLERFGV